MSEAAVDQRTFVRSIDWEPRRVSVSLVVGGAEHEVWFSASDDLYQTTDFLLPVALLPAMRAGGALQIPGEVSPRLLSSVPQVQDIFNMWESIHKHIPIEAQAGERSPEQGSGVACFFSGGLDSFHTALRHREEITHLIFLHRYEEDRALAEANFRRVGEMARDMGKTLVELDTNVQQFVRDNRARWGLGLWMAGAGLLLQHRFRKILVAGSTTSNYDNLRPQGSHPILDPLWSTENTEFFHDACEVRRVEKAAQIAEHDVAMKHLQVCDKSKGERNCGQCKKCVRTMLNLKAAGALERCETLPDEIDHADVQALDLSEYSESYFARENLRALRKAEGDSEIVQVLEEAIERGGVKIAHSGYKEEDLAPKQVALERARQDIRELKAAQSRLVRQRKRLNDRVQTLAAENSQLTARYSALRYRVADAVIQRVMKIPGAEPLLRALRKKL